MQVPKSNPSTYASRQQSRNRDIPGVLAFGGVGEGGGALVEAVVGHTQASFLLSHVWSVGWRSSYLIATRGTYYVCFAYLTSID